MPFGIFNHPVLLAAVAVVAIGVAIYEIVNNQNRSHGQQRSGPPPPPNDPRPPPPSNDRRPPPPPNDRKPPPPPNDLKPPPPSNDRKPPPPSNDQKSPPPSNNRRPSPPSNNRRPLTTAPNQSENGRPSEPDYPKQSVPFDPPYYPDHTGPSKSNEKSSDSKLVQNSKSPVNNLRRRVVNQAQSKSENTAKMASTVAVKELNETSTAGNQNCQKEKFDENNYCRNVLGKLTNDTKNVNENLRNKNISGHNIYEEESDSSENNSLSKNEEKLINQIKTDKNVDNKLHKRNRKLKNSTKKSVQNAIDKVSSDDSNEYQTQSSSDAKSDDFEIHSTPQKLPKFKHSAHYQMRNLHSSKNVTDPNLMLQSTNYDPLLSVQSDSSSSDEDMFKEGSDSLSLDKTKYVREVHETLKTDVHDSNGNNPVSSQICSLENIEKEEPIEHNFCKACEERHINTRAKPCNHAYLCVDCAVRIFRLYKKCNICLEEVAEFVQFAL